MDHFTNIKVKGVSDESGRKNYIITNTDDGSEHVAIKRESGSKYDIGEHSCLTLRQCKVLVSENRVRHFADSHEEVSVDTTEDKPERKPETWSCVDPCALLILLAEGGVSRKEINRTLDSFGWVTPDGNRDIKGAEENYSKWSKR